MLELIQITNDPAFAARCDRIPGIRLFVDLERLGKAERQAGRDTFISDHTVADVAAVRKVLRNSRLMVRINPLHAGSRDEVEAVLGEGADRLMLPMFGSARELRQFTQWVDGRAPVTALLETAAAMDCLQEWIGTPGLDEVFVGLNDLHLSLGLHFMFEPLAQGTVDAVANAARQSGRRFGFGGIASLEGGLVPGRDVLAEHLRLGSGSVILSRSFHGPAGAEGFENAVAALRRAEAELALRTPAQMQADSRRIAAAIGRVAADLAQSS